MDHIRFPYRGSSHEAFLEVVSAAGAWENHGLDVESDVRIPDAGDAQQALLDGDIDFISGNHIDPYYQRLEKTPLVYVGQSTKGLKDRLITRADSSIQGIEDLRGKRVASVGDPERGIVSNRHPGLNTWLLLKENGLDVDEGDVELAIYEDSEEIPQAVQNGEADAFFASPPDDLFAERAGLRNVGAYYLPMIRFTTLTTTTGFIEENPDITERFIRSVMEGVAFLKNNPEEAIDVIEEKYDAAGEVDREAATRIHGDLDELMTPTLLPTLGAIDNAHRESVRRHGEQVEQINPLEMWDFRFIRRIIDDDYIDELYEDGA